MKILINVEDDRQGENLLTALRAWAIEAKTSSANACLLFTNWKRDPTEKVMCGSVGENVKMTVEPFEEGEKELPSSVVSMDSEQKSKELEKELEGTKTKLADLEKRFELVVDQRDKYLEEDEWKTRRVDELADKVQDLIRELSTSRTKESEMHGRFIEHAAKSEAFESVVSLLVEKLLNRE